MRTSVLLVLFIVLLSGCKSFAPFTDAMRTQNGWGEREVKRIQFYTSDAIVLRHDLARNETSIQSGRIKTIDGRRVEEVVIPARTPGVVVEALEDGRLAVSFEISDRYYLTFGVNPGRGDRYFLLAKSWRNKVGRVTYNNRIYQAVSSSADAHLLVNMKRIRKLQKEERVARGRKL